MLNLTIQIQKQLHPLSKIKNELSNPCYKLEYAVYIIIYKLANLDLSLDIVSMRKMLYLF